MATLKRGAQRTEVKSLRQMLKALGYYNGPLDGDFGPGTEVGVQTFQEARGLGAGGKDVGAQLARMIYGDLSR